MGKNLASRRRKRGVIGWIARERRHRNERCDARIKLMRPQVPVRVLGVVAGNVGIEKDRGKQGIDPSGTRGVEISLILEHPLGGVVVEARRYAGRALPVIGLVAVRKL